MQTWFNQVTLQPCFIERSHTNTDEIGDNIINDELDTGPYIDDIQQYIDFDKRICIVTTFDKPEKTLPLHPVLYDLEFIQAVKKTFLLQLNLLISLLLRL